MKRAHNENVEAMAPVGGTPAVFYIPFTGYVPAGFPSPASDYMEQPIDLQEQLVRHPSATFYMRVEGESMIGACIPPGAIAVIDRALTARHQDIVVAVVNGEFLLKRLEKREDQIRLLSENPKYAPIPIGDGMDFSVWGVVTNVIIDTKLLK